MSRASIPIGGERNAVVVDDSRSMRALLRHALEEQGFRVSEAEDGSIALRLLSQGPVPMLVLVDWHMRGLDGLTLIRALRTSERFARMAIVMVSSEADPKHIEEALRVGADEYIMKPLSAEVLRQKLTILEQP